MENLPDLDYETALANMAGMTELYQEALQAFWLEAPLLILQYRSQQAAANWMEARRAAHSLKSAAAVMGGMRLSQAALALEKLARESVADPAMQQQAMQACEQAWQDFASLTRRYLPS